MLHGVQSTSGIFVGLGKHSMVRFVYWFLNRHEIEKIATWPAVSCHCARTSRQTVLTLTMKLISSILNYLLKKELYYALAFLLYDAGYDIWLGNYRGTEYSEEHDSLNVTQKEYWNYR
ncbi:hypothetical protein NQ315_015520 [Exocentrus adspersus]|uniref:Uncharacterized protein n=1 Tax=Exocentrus adspersus TaxID=1586481 RepID=A0AAV8VPM0_9CUCU|nr:hypothetical protein NQ315_015520 [Exocentrus adspersus]